MLKKTFEMLFQSNLAFKSAADRIRRRLKSAGRREFLDASELKALDRDMRMLDSWFSEL